MILVCFLLLFVFPLVAWPVAPWIIQQSDNPIIHIISCLAQRIEYSIILHFSWTDHDGMFFAKVPL